MVKQVKWVAGGGGRGVSTKLQAPSAREIPNPKLQLPKKIPTPNSQTGWRLLGLGFWASKRRGGNGLRKWATDSMSERSAFIGLDVGGTAIKALVFGPEGEKLVEETAATGDDGTKAWLEHARTVVRRVLAACPAGAAVGVAAPGLPARDGRSIASMPGRLAGLEGLNWQQWLGLDKPVPVFNDAQAALLGEVWLGAAKGAANVVLLTLGTGVGGAAMVDGRVLRGHLGRAKR